MGAQMGRGQASSQKLARLLRSKRGQNAVEFLVTYSWALLVVALVIALLVVMGVPALHGSEPDRCGFNAGSLGCERLLVAKTMGGDLVVQQLNITNNFNKQIYVCGAYCTDEATGPDSLPATKIPAAFNGACGSMPSPVAAIAPGETGAVAIGGIVRGQYVAFCRDASGNIPSTPVGSPYGGRLYLLYSYADEASGAPRIAVADVVSRVERQ
jgi:hypothetical protein